MSRVALYVRVSLEIQDHASQRHALELWLVENPQDHDPMWFTETISGAAKVRPEFERMMAMVDSGEVSRVVVFSLDRLGRTMSDRLVTMARFADSDCVLESITEGLADHSEEGLLMGSFKAYFSAIERRKIKQRTTAGIKARIASGRPWGGSQVDPAAKRGRRKLDDEAELAICEMVRNGTAIAHAAKFFGLPRTTASAIVRRRSVVDNPSEGL